MSNCIYCGKETINPRFCNKSCAAKYNNAHRSVESRKKQKISVRKTCSKKPTIKNQFGEHERRIDIIPEGPYTKVYLCTCKYSEKQFYAATTRRVHPQLSRNKKEYTYSCQFRFGISSYPEWFNDASNLIKEHGWYSTPGSRKGAKNLNGISRDHMYSITDGWLNDVPVELIRHPANCSLVPHKENQSKHKRSTISLNELHQRIKRFESMYGTT